VVFLQYLAMSYIGEWKDWKGHRLDCFVP
jgi:hypothetical protein